MTRSLIIREMNPTVLPDKAQVRAHLIRRLARANVTVSRFARAWMFIDRDTQADDNAEHLYRYVAQNHPEINSFFVLAPMSHDWARLKDEGFRLIPFASIEHQLLLLNAEFVLSSHADSFVLDLLPKAVYSDLLRFQFVFLQHGVIRDDISQWLNRKQIHLFITSSPSEHESIVGNGSRYKFGRHQVAMAGLARHDALLARTEPTEKTILIMPTWRQWLVTGPVHGSTTRSPKTDFFQSTYARRWRALLNSQDLKQLADSHGYRIVFFPHANMQLYADEFGAPDWVEVHTHTSEPLLQRLYRRAAVMITDYSSVFFEMGVLRKPVLYYQFDRDEMYGGGHPSRVGYFDFAKDGFGPVTESEEALLRELDHVLERGCTVEPEYLRRMNAALPHNDGENRRRTVEAIFALSTRDVEQDERVAIALDGALTASRARDSELAEIRWSEVGTSSSLPGWQLYLAEAKRELGKVEEARALLEDDCVGAPDLQLRREMELAKTAAAAGEFAQSLERWVRLGNELRQLGRDDSEAIIAIGRLYRDLGDFLKAREVFGELVDSHTRELELAELSMHAGEWGDAATRFGRLAERGTPENRLWLRAARAHEHMGNYCEALRYVDAYLGSGGTALEGRIRRSGLLAKTGMTELAHASLRALARESGVARGWGLRDRSLLIRICADTGLVVQARSLLERELQRVVDAGLRRTELAVLVAESDWTGIIAMGDDWMSRLPAIYRIPAALCIARAHRELNRDRQALLALEKQHEICPWDLRLSFAVIEQLTRMGSLDAALDKWSDAVKVMATHQGMPFQRSRPTGVSLATALFRSGRTVEAGSVLANARRADAIERLESDPLDSAALRDLAELIESGERTEIVKPD